MTHTRPAPAHRVRNSGRGFSLVELVAVIVILAIMGATATMSMTGVASNRRAAAARQIARDLGWLRERAMTKGLPTWATFNTSTDTYTFFDDVLATPGFASATAVTDPSTSRAFSQALNSGDFAGVDLLSVTATSFGFNAMGRPINTSGAALATSVTITVTGSRTATVTPQTGRIAWQ
jgi:prepilin-type N-terminal cleavage/methylation domain-containing protein